MSLTKIKIVVLSAFAICISASSVSAQTAIKNICSVKGQEENTLRGLGLVVGLSGTGEAGDVPTMKALARSYELMGSPLGQTGALVDLKSLKSLEKNKNIALVMVTATVPSSGGRRGTKLECSVSGLSGKSLAGGYLAFAALQGPNTKDRRVYALAQGQINIPNIAFPLSGKIHKGCQLEEDIFNPFEKDGIITLVIDQHLANFHTANDIVATISSRYGDVRAKDALNVLVKIPAEYETAPVQFLSEILELELYDPRPEARINIDEQSQTIVISGNVEIGAVVVTHKSLVVDASGGSSKFAGVGTGPGASAKLSNLLEALNALKVPPGDVIEILKGIDRNGSLHGKLEIK